jgi:hypothetical protein
MTIFVSFAGRELREVTFFVSHVVSSPSLPGEFPMSLWNPVGRRVLRQKDGDGKEERKRDADASPIQCIHARLFVIDNQLQRGYHRNEIQLPESASLRTFGSGRTGERPLIRYRHVIRWRGTIWEMFSCIFSSRNTSGQYFSQHCSPNYPMSEIIIGNYNKFKRIRCIDFVEYGFLNLAWNLMGMKGRSFGTRGEREIFTKRR